MKSIFETHIEVSEIIEMSSLIVKVSANETMLKVGPIQNMHRQRIKLVEHLNIGGYRYPVILYVPCLLDGYPIKIVQDWITSN